MSTYDIMVKSISLDVHASSVFASSIWTRIDNALDAQRNLGSILDSLVRNDRQYYTLIADIQSGKTQWGYVVCWYALFMCDVPYLPFWFTFNIKGAKEDLVSKLETPTALLDECIMQGVDDVIASDKGASILSEAKCTRDELVAYFRLCVGIHPSTRKNTVQVELGNKVRVERVFKSTVNGQLGPGNPVPLVIGDEWHTWCGTKSEISKLRTKLLKSSKFRMVGITATPNAVVAADRVSVKFVKPEGRHMATSWDTVQGDGVYRPYAWIMKRTIPMSITSLQEQAAFMYACINKERKRTQREQTTFIPLMLAVGEYKNNDQAELVKHVRSMYKGNDSVCIVSYNQKTGETSIDKYLRKIVPDAAFTNPRSIVVIVAHRSAECSISIRPNITRHGRTLHGLTGQIMLRVGDKCDIEEQRLRILGRYAKGFPKSTLYFASEEDRNKMDTIVHIQKAVRKDESVHIISTHQLMVYTTPVPRTSRCHILTTKEYAAFKMLHTVQEIEAHTTPIDDAIFADLKRVGCSNYINTQEPLAMYEKEEDHKMLETVITEMVDRCEGTSPLHVVPTGYGKHDSSSDEDDDTVQRKTHRASTKSNRVRVPMSGKEYDDARLGVVEGGQYGSKYVVGKDGLNTCIKQLHIVHIDTSRYEIQRILDEESPWVAWRELDKYVVVHRDNKVYEATILPTYNGSKASSRV